MHATSIDTEGLLFLRESMRLNFFFIKIFLKKLASLPSEIMQRE